MPKAYSQDLRDRVIDAVEKDGMSWGRYIKRAQIYAWHIGKPGASGYRHRKHSDSIFRTPNSAFMRQILMQPRACRKTSIFRHNQVSVAVSMG